MKDLPETEGLGPERAPTIRIPEAEGEPRHRKRRPWLRKLLVWVVAIAALAAGAWAAWTFLVPHTTHGL